MSRMSVFSRAFLFLTCCILLVIPASAQHFKQVFGFTGSMARVAAGRNEVWGINTVGQIFRFSAGKFVSIPGVLSQISVGGGTLLRSDDIWGLDSSGNIFRFAYATKSFNQITGSLAQITVGEGDIDSCHPYEVWGINANQNVFRYNYCTKQFDSISGFLTHVSTAGGAVWGLNSSTAIFAFNFSTKQFQSCGLSGVASLAADVNDVWVLDGLGNIFAVGAFNGSYGASNITGTLAQIAAGGDGVWGINSNQDIFRFDPATGTFLNVSGFLVQIAVGSGAGVWGVSPNSGEVFTFVRP